MKANHWFVTQITLGGNIMKLGQLYMVKIADVSTTDGSMIESYLMLTKMMTKGLMPICSATITEATHLTEEEAKFFMANTTSRDKEYTLVPSVGKVRRNCVALLQDRMNGGSGEWINPRLK